MPRVTIDLPERFSFETEIEIRVSDINYGGHLGNDTVLSIAHEARVRFLDSLGFSEKDVGGCGIIQRDAAVQYKSEGTYGQKLRIQVAAELEGRSACEMYYLVTDAVDGREVAIVKTGLVFFDYEKRKPTRIPEAFKASIEQDD